MNSDLMIPYTRVVRGTTQQHTLLNILNQLDYDSVTYLPTTWITKGFAFMESLSYPCS